MKTPLTVIILIATFVILTQCYSLQGNWNVKSQYLPPLTTVSITFEKKLNQTNNRIQYFMNVFACKLLRYKYIVVDNQIYLTFESEGTPRYECKPNEIIELKAKLERSFYFMIIGTQLSFFGPNNEVQIKLSRSPVSESKNLMGQWVTVNVDGALISEKISASENELQLCGGKGVISYTYDQKSKPSISFSVKKTQGCTQNEIYSTLSRSVYMRWKSASLIYLYNREYQQIMIMRRIGDQIASKTGFESKNPTVSSVENKNTQIPPITNEQKVPTNTNPTQQSGTSTIPTTNPIQNNNQTPIKQKQQPTTLKPTQISTNPTIQPTPSPKPTEIVKYLTVSDLPVLSKTEVQGKWAIKDQPQFSSQKGFFFLILPERIMLYGGCNVHFTTYALTQNTLNNINVQSTSKSCPSVPQSFKALLQKFKSWKYLALRNVNNKATLQVLDSKFNTLKTLQKIV